jgi:hypothetical protein
MKALVSKGLLSVAVELGRTGPEGHLESQELQSAAAQLAGVPQELIEFASLESNWLQNIDALQDRGWSEIVAMLENCVGDIRRDFTLHQAEDGNVFSRTARSDGVRIWAPPALDYRNSLENPGDGKCLQGQCIAPILRDGVGMGWWLKPLFDMTCNTFLTYSCALHLVETNIRALALVLHLHDWHDVLQSKRFYLFAGDKAWQQWQATMLDHPDLGMPQPPIESPRWPGQAPSEAAGVLNTVGQQRSNRVKELRATAEALYAPRDEAYWARRYQSADDADPLRVMCVTSRFTTFLQYSIRDTVQALNELGCQTRLLIEQDDHLRVPEEDYLKTIIDFEPDLIIMLDHHRHEQSALFVENVPFACWIQDPLPNLMSKRAGQALGSLDFTFGYYGRRCVEEFGYPEDAFFYAPIPVSRSMVTALDVEEEDFSHRPYDVVYVGHLQTTAEAMRQDWRTRHDRSVHPLFDAIDTAVDGVFREGRHLCDLCELSNPGRWVGQLAEGLGIKLGDDAIEKIGRYYAYRSFDLASRLQTLGWVADWAAQTNRVLRIHGNGWEQLPRFAPYAHGPIDHGEPLRNLYAQTRLAIQAMPSGFGHQRSLEALAAGCLVLGRFTPRDFECSTYEEACAQVEAGTCNAAPARRFPRLHQVQFTSGSHFAEMAESMLTDDAQYRELYQSFRDTVMSLFTYNTVLEGLIGNIRDCLVNRVESKTMTA